MNTSTTSSGPLETLSYRFALDAINFCKILVQKKEFILSKQFVKSATSTGASIGEAQFAQSRADFISKLSISLKEANESRYWLRLIQDAGYASSGEMQHLFEEVYQVIKLLVSSINTAKRQK